jgi:hypothetical protein
MLCNPCDHVDLLKKKPHPEHKLTMQGHESRNNRELKSVFESERP